MDRLLREGNPPTGQLASPKPQYKDVQTNSWEELKGEGGASYVKDKDVFAKLEQARALLDAISGKDFATQTTLAAVLAKLADLESELATIKANQLSGDQKVQLSGASGNIISPATEDKLEQVRQLLAGVATEAKLEQARDLLASISGKDFATQTTLAQVQSELALVKAELQEIKANQLSGDQKVQLKGSVAQVLDVERDAGFGNRRYFGEQVSVSLGGASAVPIVGKTVTIWFHNLSDSSTRGGVRLYWFLGGTVHDGIPATNFGDVPAGSVLGIRIGGSAPDNAPDNDQIIHVPRFGGDGVVFSVNMYSTATGNVRVVIMEESSYA